MLTARAYVGSVGLRTSVGQTALETAWRHRAGAAGMREAPILDLDGEPITMCFDPTIHPLTTGWERAGELVEGAAEEAFEPWGRQLDPARTHLSICIDERFASARSENDAAEGAAIVQRTLEALQRWLPGVAPDVVARGGAAGAFALDRALDDVASRRLESIVLVAVHTDYDLDRIRELAGAGRLFKPDNLDAFIPGEAAAILVLTRDDVLRRVHRSPMARVVAAATAFEAARPDNQHSRFEAKGLTQAVREATQPLEAAGMQAGWGFTDLTFERARVMEWQAMLIRTRKRWADPYVIESPAQRIGHLGAAAIPIGMALASIGWAHASAPAPVALVYGGSDLGERGAVLLSSP